jgi:hypothetical protein
MHSAYRQFLLEDEKQNFSARLRHRTTIKFYFSVSKTSRSLAFGAVNNRLSKQELTRSIADLN